MDPMAAMSALRACNDAPRGGSCRVGRGIGTMIRIAAWLRRSGGQDTETQGALTIVDARPADPARVASTWLSRSTLAEADQELPQQLRHLVGEANTAGEVYLTHGGAHLHAGVQDHAKLNQAGHDQIFLHLDD